MVRIPGLAGMVCRRKAGLQRGGFTPRYAQSGSHPRRKKCGRGRQECRSPNRPYVLIGRSLELMPGRLARVTRAGPGLGVSRWCTGCPYGHATVPACPIPPDPELAPGAQQPDWLMDDPNRASAEAPIASGKSPPSPDGAHWLRNDRVPRRGGAGPRPAGDVRAVVDRGAVRGHARSRSHGSGNRKRTYCRLRERRRYRLVPR